MYSWNVAFAAEFKCYVKGVCQNVIHVQSACLFLFQVSDVEKILGIVHTETIQVSAEAYDIALDISPGKKSVTS